MLAAKIGDAFQSGNQSGGVEYGPTEELGACGPSPESDRTFGMRGPSSTRDTESADPNDETLGDHWYLGRIWNHLCCHAGPDCNAQAPIERRHESENGGDHGSVSDSLGLLRFIDSFTASGAMERHRSFGQFAERRCIPLFHQERKSASKSVRAFTPAYTTCKSSAQASARVSRRCGRNHRA